jgi:hypothetical protein
VQRALADVRSRRRRTALLATSFSLAVIAAVGAGLGTTVHQDSLDVVPAGGAHLVGTPAPARPGSTAGSSTARPVARANAAPVPTSTPAVPPVVIGSARPESSTQPAASPRPGYRRRPPVERTTDQSYVDAEQGRGGLHEGGCVAAAWCATVTAASTSDAVTFRLTVCRDRSAGDGRLWFDTNQEIDISVRAAGENGREVWRWSSGQRFRDGEHDVAVPTGGCIVWSMAWDGVLDSGADLPSGDYVVTGRSLSAELGSAAPEADFTVA